MNEVNNYNQSYNNNDPFQPSGPEGKCRGVAGLLALLIGGLGIHYFYLGKSKAGIYTILLCIVTCSIWSLLTFVQGILFFTMTNQEFQNKFVATEKEFPIF